MLGFGALSQTPVSALPVVASGDVTVALTGQSVAVSRGSVATSSTGRFGALTPSGAGGIPVVGTSITSGDPSGHFTITSGYLVPSAAGDTADLNAGPYSLTLNNGDTITVSIDANARDVRTQTEWDALDLTTTTALKGKTIYLRPDSYRGGSIVTGIDGTADKLKRSDFTGLVIEGRNAAITSEAVSSDPCTVGKFYFRGTRNITLRKLAFTAVAEIKIQILGETAQAASGITINQCYIRQATINPNDATYSTSTNCPNYSFNAISCSRSGSNCLGSLTVTNNLMEHLGRAMSLGCDMASSTTTVTGNRISKFYEDAIQIGNFGSAVAQTSIVTDNVISDPAGLSTDSGLPHCDAVQFNGSGGGADWAVTIERNVVYHGNARGLMQAIFLDDFKAGGVDTGFFFTGTIIGNACVEGVTNTIFVGQAKAMTVQNNTVASRNDSGSSETSRILIGGTTGDLTTSGTHTIQRNIAEAALAYGGTPTLTDNIITGKAGATIAFNTVYDGTGGYNPQTRAAVLSAFNRKAAGPADLAGTYDAGAIGSGAVTWATTIPGNDGVTNITPDVALTGQTLTVSRGSLGATTSIALTGQSLTAARGTVAVAASDITVALSGQALTAARGTLLTSTAMALTGSGLVAARETVSPQGAVGLGGQSASVARGTVSASADVIVALTGQSLGVARGALTPAASFALIGQPLAVARGMLLASTSIAATGQSLTAARGTALSTTASALTGQSVTAAKGFVSAGADVVAALTGQSVSVARGAVASVIAAELTGQALTAARGSVSADSDVVVALTGQAVAASQGVIASSLASGLVGSGVVVARGALFPALDFAVAGQGATTALGTVVWLFDPWTAVASPSGTWAANDSPMQTWTPVTISAGGWDEQDNPADGWTAETPATGTWN